MVTPSLRVGDTRVDLLPDGVFEQPRAILNYHADGAAALEAALARWGDRPFRVDVNCFLLRGPRGVEMVDAGTGPFWGAALGRAREVLRELGVAPADVDRIYLTHVHGDHAYGLLDGGAAYFPRAEVVAPAADLAFFADPAERARWPEREHSGFNILPKLAAAYGARLRPVPFGAAAPGVELVPLPGHTPGQAGVLLAGGGAPLALLADLLHLDAEQAADPGFGTEYDVDPDLAARTRRAVLGRAADEGWIVGGGHLRGFGRVARDGDGFRIEPA